MSFHQAVATLAMHSFICVPVSFPNRVSRRFFSWFPFRKLSAYLPGFRFCAFPILSVFGVPNHILSVLLGPRPSLACLPPVAGLLMLLFLVSFLLISFVFIEILSIRVLRLPTAPVSLVLRFTPLVVSKDFDWFPVDHPVVNRHSFSLYRLSCFHVSPLGHFFSRL
jgi:hypothetical protein